MPRIIPIYVATIDGTPYYTVIGFNTNRVDPDVGIQYNIYTGQQFPTLLYRRYIADKDVIEVVLNESPSMFYRNVEAAPDDKSVTFSKRSGSVTFNISDLIYCYPDVEDNEYSYVYIVTGTRKSELVKVKTPFATLITTLNHIINLPDQTNNEGKYLYTDGENASWVDKNGPNIISEWINSAVAFETFVSDGTAITSAINSAGAARCFTDTFSVIKGEVLLYTFTADVTVAPADMPLMRIVDAATGNTLYSNNESLADGFNQFTFTITETGTARLQIYLATGNITFSTNDVWLQRMNYSHHIEMTEVGIANQGGVVWEDLRTPLDNSLAVVGKAATPVAYRGGVVMSFATNQDQAVAFTVQLPHAYKEGSDVEFHIHWTIPTSGAGGGAENVKWDFTYSWANIGGSFPVESSATATRDVQNDAAHDSLYTDIIDIDGTGKTISSQIICSLTRDVSVGSDYGDAAYAIEVDFHYQLDTAGSLEEESKT